MNISLCIVATNRYKEYLYPLLKSVEKYFLVDHNVTCHLFIDAKEWQHEKEFEEITIETHWIPSWKFPEASLFRYSAMYSLPRSSYGDYMFYIDCDSLFVSHVGDEVLAPIVATLHPGYFNGGGAWGNNSKSVSYTQPDKRKKYWCGGFSGGSSDHFYAMCRLFKGQIETDLKNNVMPEWHDETIFNKWLSETGGFLSLTPEYMMPEPIEKRVAWGINHFQPKILALEKPKNFRK